MPYSGRKAAAAAAAAAAAPAVAPAHLVADACPWLLGDAGGDGGGAGGGGGDGGGGGAVSALWSSSSRSRTSRNPAPLTCANKRFRAMRTQAIMLLTFLPNVWLRECNECVSGVIVWVARYSTLLYTCRNNQDPATQPWVNFFFFLSFFFFF
jgi:hypothetical protein